MGFNTPLQYRCKIWAELSVCWQDVIHNVRGAHLLSNWMGVGPCGWPISWRVVRTGTASLELMNPDPVSDSWTEDMTASLTLELTRIGALRGGAGSSGLMGSLGLSERKKKPPIQDHALDSLRYDASEWSHRCIWLAVYQSLALGCVAA